MANENVQVGKYTLESLTTGMYSDPKIVYREYIQNSVDSLETAVSNNLLEPQGMRIDIIINEEEATISIRDISSTCSKPCITSAIIRVASINPALKASRSVMQESSLVQSLNFSKVSFCFSVKPEFSSSSFLHISFTSLSTRVPCFMYRSCGLMLP